MRKLRYLMSLFINALLLLTGAVTAYAEETSKVSPIPSLEESGITVTRSISASGIAILILLTLLIISLALNTSFVKVIFKHKEKFDNIISKMHAIMIQNKNLKQKIAVMEKNINFLDTWKQEAISIEPSIEIKVSEIQDKQIASEYNSKYANIEKINVSAENYSVFETAYHTYLRFPKTVQYYITVDIDKMEKKYRITKNLKIAEVTETLEKAISAYPATKKYSSKWEETIKYMKKVPKDIKDEIDENLIKKVYDSYQCAK